jgi:hypothetical protein
MLDICRVSIFLGFRVQILNLVFRFKTFDFRVYFLRFLFENFKVFFF